MDLQIPGLIALLFISLGPGILWVWFFYAKDRAEPEPKRLVARAFAYGAISVFPAALLEAPFRRVITTGPRDLAALLVVSVLVVGLVEEVVKFVAVKLAAYDNREFNEVMDGVVYAVAAGLGFAAAENLFYATSFGIAVGLFRAFITDLAHASFSGIVGYYLGRAKFDARHAGGLLARGLVAAIVLHGLYDFLIIGRIVPPVFGILMILATYAYLNRKIRQAQRLSPFRRRAGRPGTATPDGHLEDSRQGAEGTAAPAQATQAAHDQPQGETAANAGGIPEGCGNLRDGNLDDGR
ncbi:MAG: PrsW family glutamic-type intramembrane protease [Bacillota bacterium]